jgi:DNA polymerase-3 subunit epsilon
LNKTVDYLIVGGQGSDSWKYGNYGGKVSKAVQMQEKGSGILIVSEEVLYQNQSIK